MRAANYITENTKLRAHIKDELFIASIRKIAQDVILKEIKNSKEIKALAIISPFNFDGKSKISDYLSQEFESMGNKTLLLRFSNVIEDDEGFKKTMQTNRLPEDFIIESNFGKPDYLSLLDLRKTYGFTFDKASLGSLLSRLRNKYKRIVIDTGALENDISGFVAASIADGVYFICNKRNLRNERLAKNYRVLKEIGISILGVIYNNAEKRVVKKAYCQNGENHG